MTQPTPVRFKDFLIKLGDGASPEVFSKAPLAMNSRGFTQTLKTTDITVPDSTNEDAVVPLQSVGDTIDRQMTGAGTMQAADMETWDVWFRSGVSKNVQITLSGTVYYTGPVLLTAFNLKSNRTDVVMADLTLKAAGDLTLTSS